MSQIVSSTFNIDPPEVDGRFYVHERHSTDDGQEFPYDWLSDGTLDLDMVLAARAVEINKVLAAREAARLAVQGTAVPLTRFEFLSRFKPEERVVVRKAAETDPYIEDYMEMMKLSGNVSLMLARPGLLYLASKGLLTSARAAEIGAD